MTSDILLSDATWNGRLTHGMQDIFTQSVTCRDSRQARTKTFGDQPTNDNSVEREPLNIRLVDAHRQDE